MQKSTVRYLARPTFSSGGWLKCCDSRNEMCPGAFERSMTRATRPPLSRIEGKRVREGPGVTQRATV